MNIIAIIGIAALASAMVWLWARLCRQMGYYKVPRREVYCETVPIWCIALLRCHVWYRLAPPHKLANPPITVVLAIIALLMSPYCVMAADQIPITSTIAAGATTAGGVTNTAATRSEYQIPTHTADMGLLFTQVATNGGGSNSVWQFNCRVGTNWTTDYPLKVQTAANGSNTAASYYRMSRTNLDGISAISFDGFSTTQTNLVRPLQIDVDWLH